MRALARLEEVEQEADLLALARHASASQLERVVRGYRGVVAVERGARGGRPERWVSWSRADDGSLLLYGRLPIADSFLSSGAVSRNGGDRHQVVVHLDAPTLRGPGRGERCELDDGSPLAADTARRLACDAAIVPLLERAGKPVGVGRKTRSIPPAHHWQGQADVPPPRRPPRSQPAQPQPEAV